MDRVLVSKDNFQAVLKELSRSKVLSIDTECTGLQPWLGDRLFSIIICNGAYSYYFNFNYYENFDSYVLPRAWLSYFNSLFMDHGRIWFIHNAKYDMGIFAQEGLFFSGTIHCTEAHARLLSNDELKYGLDACAGRIGLTKSEAVDDYISKHKLWDWEERPGRKRKKKKYFNKVPPEVIIPYGHQDSEVGFLLGTYQREEFIKWGKEAVIPPTLLYDTESKLTKVFFNMEKTGIQADLEHCKRAKAYEESRYKKAMSEFKQLTGMELVDHYASLEKAFSMVGAQAGKTELGNASFKDEILELLDSPVARTVQEYRQASRLANTYYQNFIDLADENSTLHPNYKQGGASTGRISIVDPALQTVPKRDDDEPILEFDIRKSFTPRPGFIFAEIDYKAMEFRLMIEYAKEFDLIHKIIAGFDPHQATADLTGLPRKSAKILNFGLLYGMGLDLLSRKLKVSTEVAREYKMKYFAGLPNVRDFLRNSTNVARVRGFVFDWMGRRFDFSNPNFAYKAANAIIQGGCADIMKLAMIHLDSYLTDRASRMVLQIHDAALFEIHESELHIISDLKAIMEKAYPHKLMPLECSVKVGKTSWADLVDWQPTEKVA